MRATPPPPPPKAPQVPQKAALPPTPPPPPPPATNSQTVVSPSKANGLKSSPADKNKQRNNNNFVPASIDAKAPRPPPGVIASQRTLMQKQAAEIHSAYVKIQTRRDSKVKEEIESQDPFIQGMSNTQLMTYLKDVFRKADKNNDGILDRKEFIRLMRETQLGLSKEQIGFLLAEADVNEDGVISFEEFIPVGVETIRSLKARAEQEKMRTLRDQQAEKDAIRFVHGMAKVDLESMIGQAFQEADVNGDGVLDRKEFRNALEDSSLGLTRREIHSLMAAADSNGDNQISFEEFVPLCFGILVKNIKDKIQEMPDKVGSLSRYIADLFAAVDCSSSGRLPVTKIGEVLSGADLGISRIQINSILAQAPRDGAGLVKHQLFANIVAQMIESYFNTVVHTPNKLENVSSALPPPVDYLAKIKSNQKVKNKKENIKEEKEVSEKQSPSVSEALTPGVILTSPCAAGTTRLRTATLDGKVTDLIYAPAPQPNKPLGRQDFVKMYHLVSVLEESGQCSPLEAANVEELISKGDPRLVGAFDVFERRRDVRELIRRVKVIFNSS